LSLTLRASERRNLILILITYFLKITLSKLSKLSTKFSMFVCNTKRSDDKLVNSEKVISKKIISGKGKKNFRNK